jgi:hypothetical protein
MRMLLCGWATLMALAWCASPSASQQTPSQALDAPAILELHFIPVRSAQLAIWIERASGEFLANVRLTEAVAYRGIGNRPGASEMNSGFRWPYGRREGVLPVWASRRAAAPGAQQFRRVIFQDRTTEGLASKTSNDFSADDYYCLSFDRARSRKDALDAVSCATPFTSDKGRFITDADVAAGYSEPYEQPLTRKGLMRPLSLYSLYPPRRDATYCGAACFQHRDVASFAAHAHEVMPDLDAVTMATPVGDAPQRILYTLPADWEPGSYRACIEANVEGDYNTTFDASSYPTPTEPHNCDRTGPPPYCWDSYSKDYGYPYRGQPSVVYCIDFRTGDATEQSFSTDVPTGSAGSWDLAASSYGQMQPMDGMTNDPVHAPGSGADRLELAPDGSRLRAVVKPPRSCMQDQAPSAVTDLTVQAHPNRLHAHEWGRLHFGAASDDRELFRYEVRVSTDPITDDASFLAAMPAKQATIEAAELMVPIDAKPGQTVQVDFGGMVQQTHYYIAVRGVDGCNAMGPIRSAELTTATRVFATVSPCFVATAAWGSPLAHEVGALRRLRDRHLQSNALGRRLVEAYYAVGPTLATWIREREGLRTAARVALTPAVALARWLEQ